MKIGYDTSLST